MKVRIAIQGEIEIDVEGVNADRVPFFVENYQSNQGGQITVKIVEQLTHSLGVSAKVLSITEE